jgi:DNA modification methylase
MSKIYYSDPLVTLYHGDCREILPTISAVGAIITDPPYGIDYGRAGGFSASHRWGQWRENVTWDAERPPREIFDTILAFGVPMVVWGGNYFTDYLPPRMGWIAWDKGQRDFSLADFELAWTSEQKAARCVVMPRPLALKDGKCHPTQKPIWVMSQCIEYLDRGGKPIDGILDPFAGSGTTLIAAADLNRRAIGIEIEERYCEIAARRLAARTGNLFA